MIFEHEFTRNLICPHCGWAQTGDWELSWDEGTVSCEHCERDFDYERHIITKYSTKKVEE